MTVRLLCDAWPMEPCRKLSINLSTLKDNKGRFSESPHYTVLNRTGGSMKLGGLTKQKEFEDTN